MDGYIPRHMAAQRRIANQEGLSHGLGQLCECLEGNVITNAPLGRSLLFLRIVVFPCQVAKAARDEIAAHIGEVDVATIEIMGAIAPLLL